MQMQLNKLNENRCFGGRQLQYEHHSLSCSCTMRFSVFLPPQAETEQCPVLYWLSGLTCTDENFVQKAGAQRIAAELGLILVAPDTSPRGNDVADDENGASDLGLGAGFYLNATEAPWAQHYQMYDYIVKELPALIDAQFPASGLCSISGHSMGGHGALSIALKNPETYRSVSAFAPVVAPTQCAWGQKAFAAYLGEEQKTWQAYDSTALLVSAKESGQVIVPMKIDQGAADNFLAEQLKPEIFVQACQQQGVALDYQLRQGYDHSYFFISSFIEEHLRFHAENLSC